MLNKILDAKLDKIKSLEAKVIPSHVLPIVSKRNAMGYQGVMSRAGGLKFQGELFYQGMNYRLQPNHFESPFEAGRMHGE